MNALMQRQLDWFATLTPASLGGIAAVYTDDAYFKDPFNEVFSRRDIRRIFEDMFARVDSPRFIVEEVISGDHRLFATWRFECSVRGKAMQIRGGSLLRFAADGRINYHRDYWDAAEELYEKIPVLGWILKTLKRLA